MAEQLDQSINKVQSYALGLRASALSASDKVHRNVDILHTSIVYMICICMYVYTCYGPINPPISSSRCKHFVILRPNTFLLHKRANPRVPPGDDLKNLFFKIYEVITS